MPHVLFNKIAIIIANTKLKEALNLLETALNIFNQIGAITEAEKAINTIEKKQHSAKNNNFHSSKQNQKHNPFLNTPATPL